MKVTTPQFITWAKKLLKNWLIRETTIIDEHTFVEIKNRNMLILQDDYFYLEKSGLEKRDYFVVQKVHTHLQPL